MPVDVIIDPSTGQIYWNDNAGSGSTQSIAISGNANDSINFVGYSNFFTAGGAGLGTRILATFNDAITSTFVPGTNAYDLGSSSLRWNFYGTGGNFTGVISTSSSTASTNTTTGALTVAGGMGVVGDVFVSSATGSKLSVMQSSGDEGGEIFLNKAVTNTTITTGVTIDVYQNKLRFFESGGTTRGAYIDLTACSASVATNLLSSGSGSGISSLNGLIATTQTFATGTSGTDFNISSSTSTHTFNIPYAGSGATGLVTTQAQTIAGAKTFSGQTVVSNTTASTNSASGALLVYGGIGASGQISGAGASFTSTVYLNGIQIGQGGNNINILDSSGATIANFNTSNGWFRSAQTTQSTNATTGALVSAGGLGVAKAASIGETIYGLNLTASTGWSTGGVIVSGGLGVSKASYFNGDLFVTSSTIATSTTTGALVVTGGVGIGGSLWTSTSNLASVSGVTLSNGTITGTLSGTATSAQNIATTTDTSSTLYILGSRSSTGFAGTALYVDTNISFSGSTITASLTGTATTATRATNTDITLDTTSTIYLTGSRSNSSIGSTPVYVLSGVSALGNTITATTFSGALTGTASIATSSVSSATTTDTSSTLYLIGSRSSTGFAGTALYVDSSISILGSQVTAGVWAGTAISAVNGGTGQNTYTIGDILYASSTTALSRLAAGTANSVLTSNGAGTAPSWKVASSGGSPGGSSSQIQFNNSGSFGGISFLTYNGNTNNEFVISAPYSTTLQGQLNIGLGITSFDGVSLGKFAGSASGTVLAINQASSFAGNFADFQLNGSSKFTVGFDGKITVVGVYSLPTTAGTAGSVLTSNGTGGQFYWSAASAGGGSGTVTSGTAGSVAYYTGTGTSVGGSPGFTYTTAGNGSTLRLFGGASVGNTIFIVSAPTSTSIRVGIGTNNPQYELEIVGELSATNKSFVIDHPTKPGKKLRYGSLEGPENGVYVRGELKDSNIIETPDHWEGLVHPDSFTVTLTPIGRFSYLYVEKIEDYKVFIADAYMNPIHCYYTVWAERKDIPKLITEY